jgi:fructokinase
MVGLRIGIDIGGTKMAAVVLDDTDNVLFRTRMDTPRNYDALVAAVPHMIERCKAECGSIAGVGIGMPGSQSAKTKLWRNCNMTFVNGRNFTADLETVVSDPLRIENDANCFALSEAVGGAGSGYAMVYGLTLGTGLGGGLVIDGHLRHGPNGVAGEAGHVPIVVPEGTTKTRCYCGGFGCAELYVSGTGMARDHLEVTGQDRSSPQIIEDMMRGEPLARATFNRLVDRLARLIGVLANMLDPDVIVLGGGLSTVEGLIESVRAAAPQYVFGREAAPLIVTATTAESGARGAALLWR